jgi:hypothetical protein
MVLAHHQLLMGRSMLIIIIPQLNCWSFLVGSLGRPRPLWTQALLG